MDSQIYADYQELTEVVNYLHCRYIL